MTSASDYTAYRRAFTLTCSSVCSTAGPQGPPGPQGPARITVAASYYSLATQPINYLVADPETIFTYSNTAVETGGITLVSNTRLTVPETGVYEVYYSIQISRSAGGSPEYVYIWIKKNGVDIPDTNGRISINSNNSDSLPIVPYILSLNAGDYVEFVAKATNDYFSALYIPSGGAVPGPAIPSIIVGIKKI